MGGVVVVVFINVCRRSSVSVSFSSNEYCRSRPAPSAHSRCREQSRPGRCHTPSDCANPWRSSGTYGSGQDRDSSRSFGRHR